MDRTNSKNNFSLDGAGGGSDTELSAGFKDSELHLFQNQITQQRGRRYKSKALASPGDIPLRRSSRVFSLSIHGKDIQDGLIPLIPGSRGPTPNRGLSPARPTDGDFNPGPDNFMVHMNYNDGLHGVMQSYNDSALVTEMEPIDDAETEELMRSLPDVPNGKVGESQSPPPAEKNHSYLDTDDELLDDKPKPLVMKSVQEIPIPDPGYVYRNYPQEFHGLVAHRYKKDCRMWLWKSASQREARIAEERAETLDRNLGNTIIPENGDDGLISNLRSLALGPK